jgi:hypothetical protein
MKTLDTQKTEKNISFIQLLAKGRFAEAEVMLASNPNLMNVVRRLPALRHTNFFKKRLRFYKDYARKNGMGCRFDGAQKSQMRDAFARSHCKTNALKKACESLLDSYDIAAFTTKISRIRFNKILKRRQRNRLS